MSDNDLSPALGGGPGHWPHTKPPAIKFQPPWFVERETNYKQAIDAIEDRLREQTRALGRALAAPAPPTSGQAIEARFRHWLRQ